MASSDTMRAAQVHEWGQAPEQVRIAWPPAPPPGSDLQQIKVDAVAIHQLVRSRAAGKHYTSGSLPHTIGVDGVGTLTATNQLVYFSSLGISGSLAERVNIPSKYIVPLPSGSDKIAVASQTNPAMASYMALRTRARNLPPKFTVLILGATGLSGRVAAHIAKHLGASQIIGVGRSVAKMADLPLTLTIPLKEPATATDFASQLTSNGITHIDVVLDFLYGAPASALLDALPSNPDKESGETQWIQLGSLAGTDVSVNAATLRSKTISLRGSGPGAWSMEEFARELPGMVQAVATLARPPVNLVPLDALESQWAAGGDRTVVEI